MFLIITPKAKTPFKTFSSKRKANCQKHFKRRSTLFLSKTKTWKIFLKLKKKKRQLNFSDQQKLKSFLERQQAQDKVLKNFNKKMQDNLNQFEKSKDADPFKDALRRTLESTARRA